MATAKSEKNYAASFKLKSIELYKARDAETVFANIMSLVTHFQYYEDIMLPTVSATMVVLDNAENFISSMPIQGFERVVIKVESIQDEEYEYNFRVWTVANRATKDRRQMYTLGLISEQGLFNEGLRVNATQEGEISEVVRNVMKTYLNIEFDEDLIEESRSHVKIIPTKKSPFSLIRSLQTKAVPAKTYKTLNNNSVPLGRMASERDKEIMSDLNKELAEKAKGTAGYLFFETYNGYVFKSIDGLVSAEPKIKEEFKWLPGKVDFESLYKIQEVIFEQEINMMKKLREGAYSSICCFFNINTGKYTERVYSLEDTWEEMVHLGSQTDLPVGQKTLSQYPTRVMSTVVNHENWNMGEGIADSTDDNRDSTFEYTDNQMDYLSQSVARAGIMFNQQLTISLTGHLDLSAGDLIEIRIPNQVADQSRDDEKYDPEHSGTYLIKKLNHQFNVLDQTVHTVLDLIRDSYGIKERESNVQ